MSSFRDMLETMTIMVFFISITLPVRLVLVTHVTEYWPISFGIIFAVGMTILYLTIRGKLGFMGRMIIRQHIKTHKGKRRFMTYIGITISVFLPLLFLTAADYGHQGDEKHEILLALFNAGVISSDLVNATSLQQPDIQSVEKLAANTQNTFEDLTPMDILITVLSVMLTLLLLPILDFAFFSGFVAAMDAIFGGYFVHFLTLDLALVAEGIIVMIAYKKIIKADLP